VVVFSPVRIGNPAGVNANAPITGGMQPHEMSGQAVTTQRVYPRMQAFMMHALMQVCGAHVP